MLQKTIVIEQELRQYVDPVKREYLPKFFKTGKGQYGEGDRFLGVVVPDTRQVARRHKEEPFDVMAELLQNDCLLYTSPSPRDMRRSRMPSSA